MILKNLKIIENRLNKVAEDMTKEELLSNFEIGLKKLLSLKDIIENSGNYKIPEDKEKALNDAGVKGFWEGYNILSRVAGDYYSYIRRKFPRTEYIPTEREKILMSINRLMQEKGKTKIKFISNGVERIGYLKEDNEGDVAFFENGDKEPKYFDLKDEKYITNIEILN